MQATEGVVTDRNTQREYFAVISSGVEGGQEMEAVFIVTAKHRGLRVISFRGCGRTENEGILFSWEGGGAVASTEARFSLETIRRPRQALNSLSIWTHRTHAANNSRVHAK